MPSRRRKCQVCGSKTWHKEQRTGMITCGEGHVLQNYRAETNDTTDLGSHLVKKRTLRAEKKSKSGGLLKEHKAYHGSQARYLYFQCLQLLFRKQIVCTKELLKLPNGFESICRDLWAMHLSLIPLPPEPEHLLDEAGISVRRSEGTSHERRENYSDSDSNSSPDSEESDIDLPQEYLPNQGAIPQHTPLESVQIQRGRRSALDFDGPIYNIVLLILACWLLRIPITYMDLIRSIEQHRIPYLEPLSHISDQMAEHLSKYVRNMITPRWAPQAPDLHAHASRMAKLLHYNYAISVPELNFPPLLWRLVRHFRAPGIIYEQSRDLAEILDIPLTLHHTLNLRIETKHSHDPYRYEGDCEAPELMLAVIVIVAFKLHYLDEKLKRSPLVLDLGDHVEELRIEASLERDAHKNLYSQHASRTVLELDDSEIDRYLYFCDSALVKETSEIEPIRHMFCVRLEVSPDEDLLATRDHGDPNSDGYGPGDYAVWCRLMVESAARFTGWPEEDVQRTIERFERRLVRVWRGKKIEVV